MFFQIRGTISILHCPLAKIDNFCNFWFVKLKQSLSLQVKYLFSYLYVLICQPDYFSGTFFYNKLIIFFSAGNLHPFVVISFFYSVLKNSYIYKMLNFPPNCADMYLHFSAYSGPKFLLKSFLNWRESQPFKIAICPSVLPIMHCSWNLTVNILSLWSHI